MSDTREAALAAVRKVWNTSDVYYIPELAASAVGAVFDLIVASPEAETHWRQKIAAQVRSWPHADWCCAKGCAGPGFCPGCDDVCNCEVEITAQAINPAASPEDAQ